MVRPATVLLAALAGLVGALFSGRTSPDRIDPGRHVILVVVDTLRADHVGVYGRTTREVSPNLDRLARRASWLLDARSPAPWTPPSARSLLTSLDPAVHGLDRDASEYEKGVPQLPPRVRTLPQLLAAHGYRTRAVTGGGGVDRVYALDRGFETWYQPETVTGIDVREGVDRALSWLGRLAPGEKAFLLLHTYEVHLPNTHHLFREQETGDERARASAAYDGDVAAADREIGRFLRELERLGLLSRSLVVVTSDHGENLYDRVVAGRGVEHGHHLHDELTHVPLIFHAPGLLPARGPIPGPASLLDVMPTILSLVGAAPPDYPLQGLDLRGALQLGTPLDPGRALFAGAPFQGPRWRSVRVADRKLVLSPPVTGSQWWHGIPATPEAVFDLRRDPEERVPLIGARSPARAHLLALLRNREREEARLRDRLGPSRPGPGHHELGAIGYLR